MNQNSTVKELLLLLPLFFLGSILAAQDCINPESVCPDEGSPAYSYLDGAPSGVGAGFCFSDAPNAVFYSFETQDTDQFPFIDYSDSTAVLQVSVDSCLADTSLGIAVFEAPGSPNACDPSTWSEVFCTTDSTGGGQAFLTGLMPATTYYVMVTGLDDGAGASECFFNIGVSGPALEYDLLAGGYPDGGTPSDADSTTQIFQDETVILVGEGSFGDLTWSGQGLNQVTGPEVSANPEGVDTTVPYTVTAEINGCQYTDQVAVEIRRPIVPYNTFTPNGDGINDTWEIEGIDEWPNAQIFVYSRWGNKVFQATNYEEDWGGDDLPAATYYYVIELNPVDFDADPITGSVTIMR